MNILTDTPVDIQKTDNHEGAPKLKPTTFHLIEKDVTYLHGTKLYFAYFEKIPNIKRIRVRDSEKVIVFIEELFADQIVQTHHQAYFNRLRKKMCFENKIFVFKAGFLLDIEDSGAVYVLYDSASEEKSSLIFKLLIEKFLHTPSTKKYISILTKPSEFTDIPDKKPKLNLSLHYNDDLMQVHQTILKKLRQPKKSGILLFHGIPGTGKSTYIRHLLHHVNKRFIFLPTKTAGSMDLPEMMNLLIENQNSVLMIEDAEDLIVSRENTHNSALSLLLNLTDGVLSSLSIQIICTFNTNINNIDKALLRQGRLIGLYEFKPLTIEKSKTLLDTLGHHDYQADSPMTLAEIYHIQENHFDHAMPARSKIGF